jgi:hypothetical protein
MSLLCRFVLRHGGTKICHEGRVMPTSKHRRKAGGKSIKHPGRGKLPRERPPSPDMVVWGRFSSAYNRPFHRQWPDNPGGVGEMVDIVSAAVLDMRAVAFRAVDKSETFTEFLEPLEDEDGTSVTRTPEQAEAALAFLVEQAMVVVVGELISIHPRFSTC